MIDSDSEQVTTAEGPGVTGVGARTELRWAEVGKLPIRRNVKLHLVNVGNKVGQTSGTSNAVSGRVAPLEEGTIRAEVDDPSGRESAFRPAFCAWPQSAAVALGSGHSTRE